MDTVRLVNGAGKIEGNWNRVNVLSAKVVCLYASAFEIQMDKVKGHRRGKQFPQTLRNLNRTENRANAT